MTTPLVSLSDVSVETTPFTWYHVRRAFPPGVAGELDATFPTGGFTRVCRTEGDKSYTMWYRRLHPDAPSDGECPPAWDRFVEYVTGEAYRAELSRLTGLSLRDAPVEVNLWRYHSDCWLDPHVDKPDKLVTHILYFNAHWPADAGGNLVLLESRSPDTAVRRVAPLLDTGIVLVRSDDSWHAVERVRESGRDLERRSAQVIFHTAG